MAIAFAREGVAGVAIAARGAGVTEGSLRFDSNHRTQNKDIGDRC